LFTDEEDDMRGSRTIIVFMVALLGLAGIAEASVSAR
jgi:hypothetical protein